LFPAFPPLVRSYMLLVCLFAVHFFLLLLNQTSSRLGIKCRLCRCGMMTMGVYGYLCD
jgi:hypothetical protein